MLAPKTDNYTPDALIQWLRKQPANEEYIWQDPVFCLMGRYLADHGSQWGARSYSDIPGYYEIAQTKPWTFGAALERAEALQLPAPVKQLPPPVTVDASKSRELVTVDAG